MDYVYGDGNIIYLSDLELMSPWERASVLDCMEQYQSSRLKDKRLSSDDPSGRTVLTALERPRIASVA